MVCWNFTRVVIHFRLEEHSRFSSLLLPSAYRLAPKGSKDLKSLRSSIEVRSSQASSGNVSTSHMGFLSVTYTCV